MCASVARVGGGFCIMFLSEAVVILLRKLNVFYAGVASRKTARIIS